MDKHCTNFRYKPCKVSDLPERAINFNNVRDVNEWYFWLDK